MAKDTVISVILRLRDEMGRAAKTALDALTQAARASAQGAGAAAKGLDAVSQAARGTAQGAGGAARAINEASRSAGAFRSDRLKGAAQEAARLARESREAKRELDAATKSGDQLAKSMGRVAGAGRTAMGIMRGIGQAGAGVAAGAGVMAATLRQPIDFEKRMTRMANTAFADEKNPEKRFSGRTALVDAVNDSVRQGGGTRESAAEALDAMLASGAIKQSDAQRVLPIIQKFASASGAQSSELADIVIGGVQNKFFTVDEAEEALDKALAAGQAGGFELKDMAKWLRKFMALGSGMRGMKGYEQILAYSQAAVTTAGSKDDAGNNLVNWLQKLNSQDTQKDFKKIGVDLAGTLIKARGKGILPLEAFAELVERQVISKDKRYLDLKKKLGNTTGEERKQILNDMSELAAASAIGQVVQDRQFLLALIAGINQKDYIKDVQGQIAGAAGAGDLSFETYKKTTAYSVERAANEAEIARSGMLSDASGPLKTLADGAANLAQKFPTLATVATEATTAIAAMTATAATFGAMRWMAGGGAGAGAGAAGAAASGSGLWGALKGKAGWIVTAGLAAYDIISTEANDALTRAQKNMQHSENAGGLAGALAFAKMGAAAGGGIGAAAGGVGAVPGAVVGGVLGGFGGWLAGTQAGRQIGQWIWGPSSETSQAARDVVVKDQSTIVVDTKINVDGREMARVVNEHNAAEAKRQ